MLTYNISAGEQCGLSFDGTPMGRAHRGSGSHSPLSVPYAATIPRSYHFNPIMIAVPGNRSSTNVGRVGATMSLTMTMMILTLDPQLRGVVTLLLEIYKEFIFLHIIVS
jgi:hypothetical protein